MGYVVEVLFHLAPPALFLFLLISLFPRIDHENMIWPCLLVVATLEPTFQVYFFLPDQPPRRSGPFSSFGSTFFCST